MAIGKGDFRWSLDTNPPWRELAKLYGGVGAIFKDWREPLASVAPRMAEGIEEAIDTEGASIGESGWTPLDREYLSRKRSDGLMSAPWHRTGRTRKGIRRVSLTKSSVSVGWRGRRWEYVPALNFGARRSRGGTNPARPVMGWSPKMKKAVQREAALWLRSRLRAVSSRMRRSG